MAQETQFFPLQGGLDVISPPIQTKSGSCIAAENYESHPKGYKRIDGYERYDGRQKPSTSSYWIVDFDAGTAEIAEGNVVDGDGGAQGTALIAGVVESGSYGNSDAAGYLVLTNVTGTFVNNEDLDVSAVKKADCVGTQQSESADTDALHTTYINDAHETARGNIAAMTGSGITRGVWTLKGVSYAFRDNAGATACIMFKATTSGWTVVALGERLVFTSGGTTEIEEGDVIDGATSSAQATVTRVALHSGSWAAGDAAGYLIFASHTGTFQAENLDVGVATNLATISADAVSNSLVAGGAFDFDNHNFGGHSGSRRMYGADGVSMGFEFDGTVFVPIKTGMTADTPTHVAVHRKHLFFAFSGGSLQHSGIGVPLTWTVISGALELGVGDTITGIYSDVNGFLVVATRNTISILYGNDSSNWDLLIWSDESGVIDGTIQKLGAVMFMDDLGLRKLENARDYGNFKIGTLTQKVEPILRTRKKAGLSITTSIRTRGKDMYRFFYSDGSGLSVYLGRGLNKPEIMPFDLPIVVHNAVSGEDSNGDEILLIGGINGFVFELDAGGNFDSAEITAYIRLPFNHLGSPRRNKQFFKATAEVDADPSVELAMTAEFSYAEDDSVPAQQQDFTVEGGGGFWEEGTWDDFNWSSAVEGLAEADVDGIGTNISVSIASAGTYENPHKLHGMTLHFSNRGLER